MDQNSPSAAPLTGIRVVDLATPRAELAGRLLADLGAEVIKVEPPGGCAARFMPPFETRREGDAERSLYWAAVGLGKKSVELDLDDRFDRERLLALVMTADVLMESFDPGVMAKKRLDYMTLSAFNPRLVYVSVTPFGQDGPEAGSPATDLTLEAAGGLLSLQGDGDRPPVPVGYPQASFHAGAQAAADAVVALHERMRSGLGQHLDVSAQAAMVWTLMNATGYPPMVHANPPGFCEQRALPPVQLLPGLVIPRTIECADGFVGYTIALPVVGTRTHHEILRWAESEGALPGQLSGIDWNNWIAHVMGGVIEPAKMILSLEVTKDFLRTKTKAEVQAFAVRTGTLLAPFYTVEDLVHDPQLIAREYWTNVGGRLHPGPFAKLSRTRLTMNRPAPRLGEHQDLVRKPVPERMLELSVSTGPRKQAFAGLKVADFAWVGVGPIISKALGDHGATVVHVESSAHPDVLRLLPPFKDGVNGLNRSQFMADFNTSKLGLACDLSTDAGRELAKKVVDWADVVVESFTPGTLKKFGLDYETLSKGRPDLVMLSSCLRGQTGPEAAYTGFGGQGACLAGLQAITGWPDRPPAGPWGAYTDFINPRFGVAALTAALMHRAETGLGQYIDLAQGEAATHFLEPLVLDYTVNGRIAGPAGLVSLYAAPHGVYAAEGVERYVAIAVEREEQWQALRATASLGIEDRFAREAVDAALSAWCAGGDAFAMAKTLRQAGVPAYAVLRPTDLYEDPQLDARGFFVTLEHTEMGPTPYDGLATRFSETPGKLRKAAPCLGEDTDYVLRELLGLSEDEVVRLAVEGALS